MGRNRDPFWDYVDNEKRCIYCGMNMPGANRIKYHLAQEPGGGIKKCSGEVPNDIKAKALSAINKPNKRAKPYTTSSDLNENNVNSKFSSGSTGGELEVDLFPKTDLVSEEFQKHLDDIWDWLMGDEVSIMGVWGMGGAGKTALLKHIHNKLHIHNHGVIWIPVSQNYRTHQLQRNIAMKIDINILENEDEEIAAMRLLRAFKKMNKCVVILDDMWCNIFLEDVGIPLKDNEIKIIVASRLLDVCRKVGCKEINIVKVKPLGENTGFTLFLKTLGDDVAPNIRDKARWLTEQCEGLPLAIVALARSMRGKTDLREWTNALSKLDSLEKDHNEIKEHVLPVLKSSFDRSNERTLQDCFLCLSLCFHKKASRTKLIRSLVDEGLINGGQDLQNESHCILNQLINNSLLVAEGCDFRVRIHGLVWAMAAKIGKESYGYMYKKELPDEQEWKDDIHKFSLFSDDLRAFKIPFDMSPRCPKLSTFRMCADWLKEIPNNFFMNMPDLKILDLSNNWPIESLPASISNLKCLTVLLLTSCGELYHIPSLAELRQLRRLDLRGTDITQVPQGFENLTTLRWLYLGGTAQVEAQDLERLQTLESIGAIFIDKDEFIASVKIIRGRKGRLTRVYFLGLVGDVRAMLRKYGIYHNIDSDKTIEIEGVEHSNLLLPPDFNEIKIEGCNQWKSLCVLSIQRSYNDLHISTCSVRQCNELEYLFCFLQGCTLCCHLSGLDQLELRELDSLSILCKENKVAVFSCFPSPFSFLGKLSIRECKGMKILLTFEMAKQLRNLEEIVVEDCESMEEIISRRMYEECCSRLGIEPNEAAAIDLPKLRSVSLSFLLQLNTVYTGIINCASLKEFSIVACPKLQRPILEPTFEIQEQEVTESDYESSSESS